MSHPAGSLPTGLTVLFVDLDGTLLDVFERYHRLHVDLVEAGGGTSPIERADYVTAKRARVPEPRIVASCFGSTRDVDRYMTARAAQIELRRYLAYDQAFPWTTDSLSSLRRGCGVHLITARKRPAALDAQLRDLGLATLLDSVTTVPDGDKAAAIAAHPAFDRDRAMIVGDTELDIVAGAALGIPTVAVTSGLRDETRLREAGAVHITASIAQLRTLTG